MPLSTLVPETLAPRQPTVPATLLVVWQHPESRQMDPVARLDRDRAGYRLRYLTRARSVVDFRPLLGFADLTGDYSSASLFSLFAGRAMSPRRPDYRAYREALGLDPLEGPWEELARSQGTQRTDTIQLFAIPTRGNGDAWVCRFLVHGIRHAQASTTPDVQERIDRLTEGDELVLVDDDTNEHNPRAVLTADPSGAPLGCVPNFLLDHVAALRETGEPEVTVARANSRDVAGHLRLTALMQGSARSDYVPFHGGEYEPLG